MKKLTFTPIDPVWAILDPGRYGAILIFKNTKKDLAKGFS